MIAAIIQVRVDSTRLSGKVLKRVLGKAIFEHQIMRVKRARRLDSVIIATTTKESDDAIVRIADKLNIPFFRGSEEDLLDRYYQAACKFGVDDIVRITGDCPLIDPQSIDLIVGYYITNKDKFDYVSNVHPPTYPDGYDVEVFKFAALERSWREAKLPSEREHVYPYMFKVPKMFKTHNITCESDLSHIRLTLDEEDDLTLIRKIYRRLYPKNPHFGLKDVLELLEQNPRLVEINQHVAAKPVSRWSSSNLKN